MHQLRWLASEGVTDVVYSIGYLGDLIRDALAVAPDLGCTVRFVDEGRRDSGRAARCGSRSTQGVLDETFFVLYGDSYLRVDLGRRSPTLRGVRRRSPDDGVPQRRPVGHEQRRVRRARVVRYDKHEPDPHGAGMHHIDYGLSVLRGRQRACSNPRRGAERPRRHDEIASVSKADSRDTRPTPLLRDRFAGRAGRPPGPPRPESPDDRRPLAADRRPIALLVPDDDVADPELSIVIPALNEELTVGDFVDWCKRGPRRPPASPARS